MTRLLTMLLTLAIIMLSTGYAVSDEENDKEIEKRRAELIVMPDMSGAIGLKWLIVYGEDENPIGVLLYDKYGKQVLSIGDTGTR